MSISKVPCYNQRRHCRFFKYKIKQQVETGVFPYPPKMIGVLMISKGIVSS